MFDSPFSDQNKTNTIENADVIFVSDMFVDEYVGGAELTSQALIDSCPNKIACIKSGNVNKETIAKYQEKYWIFGNFSGLTPELIPLITNMLNYSVLEYDYKFCKYRSPEKHQFVEGKACDCAETDWGKAIINFYLNSDQVWFMSEKQMEKYTSIAGPKAVEKFTVLSSVFDDDFFARIKSLREKNIETDKTEWVVLGSSSWIKGAEDAEKWCIDNKKQYRVVWGLPYNEVLEVMASSKGFVYLPKGGDTCPRMVIEAKLLGCELHLNENVEHSKELWFDTDEFFDTEAYLYAARERFWSSIKIYMQYKPTISAYTTTKDCIDQGYPWKECITSMLGFADEVVVVDGGSRDGTWEKLASWSEKEPKLKIKQVARNWNHPRFAIFDGQQKAEARSLCTKEFLWQQDADEVVHEIDYEKIYRLCRNFPRTAVLVSLPVIEYWGSNKKVRCDINPWKWRLSKNVENITHGIPANLRKKDKEGNSCALPGTDGCDYVFVNNGEVVPNANFYTQEVHNARVAALAGNEEAFLAYQGWFNNVIDHLPGVHHYSWIDISRKMRTYKNYWQKHWESLYDIPQEDTAENNMFFGKPWSEVSDDEIEKMSSRLSEKMGGWIFHSRVDFNKPTPHLKINRPEPKIMLSKND